MAVLLETSVGDIEIDLYVDEAPKECLNFLKLCKTKYYNFSLFHRVLKNFIAQTGDPTSIGRGGECIWGRVAGPERQYYPRQETNRIKHQKFGTLSMTNNGNDMHGSQFFITLGENLDSLDGRHSVFGEVVEDSYEVLYKLNEVFCDDNGRPYQDVRVRHTIVLDDPFDDIAGMARLIPETSPEPTAEQLKTVRIADDEALNDHEGMSEHEVTQIEKKKVARAQATILEMVGDIADADAAPPENVLFVAKLNPVTTEEDLEVIFSRFGKIISCQIVTDFKTKESLQYGFVEFEKQESAEEAYFKMDNVLVDDRRIVVNFCQSIQKNKYQVPKRYNAGGEDGPRRTEVVAKSAPQRQGEHKYSMVFDEEAAPQGSSSKREGNSKPRDRDRDRRDRHRDVDGERHSRRSGDRERDRKRDKDRDNSDRHRRDRGREEHREDKPDRDRSRNRDRDGRDRERRDRSRDRR